MISEESFVDFKCPYCRDTVSFPRENAGHVQACPSCFEALLVPADGSSEGGRIPLPLTTARLLVRRFAPADWKDLLELMSDEELFQYYEVGPMDEEGVLRWLDNERHVRLTTPDQLFCLGVQLHEPPKLIGYLGLQFRDSQCQQAVSSMVIQKAYQHQGYALEALQAVLRFCFGGLNMHRLSAFADSRNVAALRLFEAAGLQREAQFREDRFVHGEWVTTVWFGALKKDHAVPARPGQ